MVRYKRRRHYRKSTNTVMMKFQSFMDISTDTDSMQIISVSAGGKNILERLPAQFAAYKYYRIGNIAVKLVPASTLPVDPSGLSYEVGEPGVDPRDQLTPGMMRITNGEDVFEDLTNVPVETQHAMYNAMLLDPRWFKWMLQSGVKRHATPRYWQIGQLHQDKWPGSVMNVPNFTSNDHEVASIKDTTTLFYHTDNATVTGHFTNALPNFAGVDSSSAVGLFQVGHRGVLGWLPTDGMKWGQPFIASPPEIEVMKIILPPAYKTKYYYRMFITETVYFKEPVMQFAPGGSGSSYRSLDVFHTQAGFVPELPKIGNSTNTFTDARTGGNYGDN